MYSDQIDRDLAGLSDQDLAQKTDHELLLILISELRAVRKLLEAGSVPQAGTNAPSAQFSGQPSGPFIDQVRAIIQSKGLIDAIKFYRQNTNVGLKEAKDAVEAIRDRKM